MCAKNVQDPLNSLQVNCGEGWRAAGTQRTVHCVRFCRWQGWGWRWTFVVPSPGPRVMLLLHSLPPSTQRLSGPLGRLFSLSSPSPLSTLLWTALWAVWWKASQETGARRWPWRRLGSRVLRGLTCGCPDCLTRVEHSWEHWRTTAPQSQGLAPVRTFAPFFTQPAVSTSAAGSALSSEIAPAPRGDRHTAGRGAWVLTHVCVSVRACMHACWRGC